MNTHRLRRLELNVALVPLLFFCASQVELARASNIPTVYREAFQILHDGHSPEWKGIKEVNAWFELERDRIEVLTLEWLGAPHDTVQWRKGLLLSRKLGSPAVCERVFESVRGELVQVVDPETRIQSETHRALAGPIAVLAACGEARALPALHRLVADSSCPRRFVEEYLRALRSIGNPASVKVIQRIDSRKADALLDRDAKLTEKILLARAAGRSIFDGAKGELRSVTRAWIDAIESQNMQAYLNVLPFGARGSVDEYDFKVELLQSPELPNTLEAARRAAEATDDAFQIDVGRLEASFVVDGRYKFLYVLEVEGWKMFGPLSVGP